nr:polysaccharide export protein EpsE [uncultured Duganella sp.]
MKRYVSRMMMVAVLAGAAGLAGAAELPLGASDVVKVSVYNNPDLTVETRVSDSGFITFPLLGQVEVGGLPTAGAEKKIAGLLESGGFVKRPQVNILVSAMLSQQVSVLGQVNRPGRFPLDSARTVLDMLAVAGGVSADGADVVTLVHQRAPGAPKEQIDVVSLVRDGAGAGNVELRGGDIVYVERAPRFYIYGEVQRAGMFKLERGMTVLQALASGGGLTPRGTERGLRIKRRDANGALQVLEAKHDDLVQPDDVVFVKESLF